MYTIPTDSSSRFYTFLCTLFPTECLQYSKTHFRNQLYAIMMWVKFKFSFLVATFFYNWHSKGYHKCIHVSTDVCQNAAFCQQRRIHTPVFWILQNTWFARYFLSTCILMNSTLQWRHSDRNGVSNHQPHDCLLNRLFRHRWKETSKLRVTGLCAGIHRWPVNSPHKGPVTRKKVFIW